VRIAYTNIAVASPPVLEPADYEEQESDVEGMYLMLTASWVLKFPQWEGIIADSVSQGRQRTSYWESPGGSGQRYIELLAKCQKLIKIADRSEYGWGVVVEYTANELDNSDDIKC